MVFCLVIGGASGALAAPDDEPKDEVAPELRELRQKLSSIKEWQGVWEMRNSVERTSEFPDGFYQHHYEERTRGSFLLKRAMNNWTPRRGILTWQGEGEAIGQGRGSFAAWTTNVWAPTGRTGQEWEEHYAGSMPQRRIEFKLWFGGKSRLVSLHPGSQEEKESPRIIRTGHDISSDGRFNIDENHVHRVLTWYLGNNVDERWAVVRGGSTVFEFTHEAPATWPGAPGTVNEMNLTQSRRSRVLLIPVHDNLEVELEIAGYDQWRPKGKISDPKKPGNNLKVRATLKNKDGTPPEDLPPVARFVFELIDTSREPGICLNWPLNARDNDPDLRLAEAEMKGELSKEDQKFIIKTVPKDEQDQPYADVQVDSYDFGGQSELRVICELEDGREVVGLLKDDKGGKDLVRVPKMDGPGWIAESWRKQHGVVDLADNDDEEKVEGQDYKGDGFTLYEEYRGFVENGVHISGDPKKKDLFILNRADVATRSGIVLLEKIAQLKVHARLRDGKEMDGDKRVMNGNRRAAPHRVDQHGVVLSHVGMGRGGYTASIDGADENKAFRPRYTKSVYIEPPDAAQGLFSAEVLKKYDLEHLSSSQLYAAAVAHELLHAIGLDHHGERRQSHLWAYFQRTDNPRNPTRQPRFTQSSSGAGSLALLWEDTQDSVAKNQQVVFEQFVANSASGHQESYRDSAEYWCSYLVFVGPLNGTDSGDETCVMRYYFATAYETKGKQNTFYVIRPGAKQTEGKLCTEAKGTGGNAASHQPQPRFGDAAGGRGDCFAQVCPNDAIPPRSTAIK